MTQPTTTPVVHFLDKVTGRTGCGEPTPERTTSNRDKVTCEACNTAHQRKLFPSVFGVLDGNV